MCFVIQIILSIVFNIFPEELSQQITNFRFWPSRAMLIYFVSLSSGIYVCEFILTKFNSVDTKYTKQNVPWKVSHQLSVESPTLVGSLTETFQQDLTIFSNGKLSV